ncbi:hypothetical protein Pla110_44960 [Polystyrenella longa]|uniref:Uncharacterized protein n=2 Tax=Polystyrenella longa TaxID=2528007 RepID=A0A518CU71_9PLAN|nr:hypothetical protein Pla110_44960 [Polystyrenella longa]
MMSMFTTETAWLYRKGVPELKVELLREGRRESRQQGEQKELRSAAMEDRAHLRLAVTVQGDTLLDIIGIEMMLHQEQIESIGQ